MAVDVEALNAMLIGAVPFNRVLGIRVAAIEPERAEVLLPEASERLNHVGTVHAAALFGLGEATSGAIMLAAFGALQTDGIVPLAVEVRIAYKKASRGDMRGVATLSRAEQERVRAEVSAAGKSRFVVPVQLVDAGETSVASGPSPRRRTSRPQALQARLQSPVPPNKEDAMRDAAALHELMVGSVPFTRVLGLRVVAADHEHAELAPPDEPGLRNHVGTVHAAAQFGLGENASAVMAIGAFSDLQQTGALLLTSGATIRYVAPAKGELRAVATLPAAEQARVRTGFAATGRADFAIHAATRDASGGTTTHMEVT